MANKTVKGTAKADKITVKESNINLYAGSGNDSITVWGCLKIIKKILVFYNN